MYTVCQRLVCHLCVVSSSQDPRSKLNCYHVAIILVTRALAISLRVLNCQGRLSLSTVGLWARNAPRTIFCGGGGGGIMKSLTNFSIQKSNCCQMSFSLSEYTKIDVGWSMSAGASIVRRPHSGMSLQRSPRLPGWFQGGRFAAGGEWTVGEGRTRGRGKRGREGKGRMGKGGRREKLGQ